MLYLVPGALAGLIFYLLLLGVSMVVERLWSSKRRLRAHSRLVIHCLAAVAFTFVVVVDGEGGNWATHMQIAGFLLSGCLLSSMTALLNARKSAAPNDRDGAGTGEGSS